MKTFKFKEGDSNIEKLYKYALYKYPGKRSKIEYDSWGQFVFYKKDKDVSVFYYTKNSGDLYINVYKKTLSKIDKTVIKNFRNNPYQDDRLKLIFDKILKPLAN